MERKNGLGKLYLRVGREKAELVRQILLKKGVFDRSRKVVSNSGFIHLPISKRIVIKDSSIVTLRPVASVIKPRSLKQALIGKLSEGELTLLNSAFDVIGDVAVLDVPKGLSAKRKLIANAMLKTFGHIKVVALKESPVSSEYRVRNVRVIAGENRTLTVHREHGCLYKLDVASTYFSPRLGGERIRVASQVKAGERVLVMFAGIGPYAILIAKKRSPREVVAVELNPDAARFIGENARLNKVSVVGIEGDVRSVVPNLGKFDRIIMPLPKDAGDFLDVALPALNKNGIIHFYDFAENPEESEKKVRQACKKLGFKIKILESVVCGSYSKQLHRICVDLKLAGK